MKDRKPTTRMGEARVRIETRADEPVETGRFTVDIHLTKANAHKLMVYVIELADEEQRELDIRKTEDGDGTS